MACSPRLIRRTVARLGGALLALVLLAACGGSSAKTSAQANGARPATLRLGYFANLTHAPALVGVESGRFQKALGSTKLETTAFNAGPAAVTALLSGGLDAAFIGPNPALTAYLTSDGTAVRVVAGAASGGASLIVRRGIERPEQLQGKRLSTPQRGNTQDVALRTWLKDHGLETTLEGGGDVSILPQENAQTLDTFRSGAIDGAWVPEPWATRLVDEGGGNVLVDERDLWPRGQFATTLLVVRTDVLSASPQTVAELIGAEIETIDFLNADAAEGQKLVNKALQKVTGKALADRVIAGAWPKLHFTPDPIAASVTTMAAHAREVGLLPSGKADVRRLYQLDVLNARLEATGKPQVAAS